MNTRAITRRRAVSVVAILLVGGGLLLGASLAHAADCTNSPQDPDCTVPYTRVPLPSEVGVTDHVEVSPINIGGDVDCSGDCGYFVGTGPIAVGGNVECSGRCGNLGTGPLAVGGNANCYGVCGQEGTGPIAVGGDANCYYEYCGNLGTSPIAVGGNAGCYSGDRGCGWYGTAPIATGDVTCSGSCGAASCLFAACTPRSSHPAISVAGHAYCAEPLDASKAIDPNTAQSHFQSFGCVSPRDVVGV